MKKIRFGMIGCGMISNFHARAIEQIENAELAGCYDAYLPNAEAFSKKYGATVFRELENMLQSDNIDAVCVCTPSGMHTPQAVAAMRAGKHVVCEKPMSLTLAEADQMIETQRSTGVKVCVISQYRYTPAMREVQRAINAGAFGRIVSGSLQMKYFRSDAYYNSASWRGTWAMDGGGALMNQGIHGIDMFRTLMGPVRQLCAYARTQTRKIEVEDSAVAILEFENGAIGTIEGSTTCYPGYPRRIEICGDQGSVVMEEDAIMRWDLDFPTTLTIGKQAENVASSNPAAISGEGHVLLIGNLVDSILDGAPLMADVHSGRLPLEIIMAIYESSKAGGAPVRF